VPYEQAPGAATARVTAGGAASRDVPVEVAVAAPGILVFPVNRAVVVNPDGSLNTTDTPAAPGGVVTVYLIGQGQVDHPVATGSAAPLAPLSRPVLPVSARIGDQDAEVLFLGLAPGFIGLAQANIRVPALPASNYPVTITIGGAVSNAPLITVK
jgi:uncharacterized protein (TIGR03437 family)